MITELDQLFFEGKGYKLSQLPVDKTIKHAYLAAGVRFFAGEMNKHLPSEMQVDFSHKTDEELALGANQLYESEEAAYDTIGGFLLSLDPDHVDLVAVSQTQ